MAVLDHHIVAVADKDAAASFFAEVLGLEPPGHFGPFAVLKVSADTSLDFLDTGGQIVNQHYAFLVTETEFDEIFARIQERQIPCWSDPAHHDSDHINHRDGGRGVYFLDPNGHSLEIITRPYGSDGTQS